MTNQTKDDIGVAPHVDPVVGIEVADDDLSSQVDVALRDEVARLRRHHAMETLLNCLDTGEGLLDSQDEAEIVRYMRMLGGT